MGPCKKQGPEIGNQLRGSTNGVPETIQIGSQKYSAPDGAWSGVVRGFFVGPQKIWGFTCPEVNTDCGGLEN